MRELAILTIAAALEVGGDALIRKGLREGQYLYLLFGAIVLFVYGLTVNLPKWDFGQLLGVYIAAFFVVAQVVAYFIFHEEVQTPMLVGGAFIIVGGLVMTFWKMDQP